MSNDNDQLTDHEYDGIQEYDNPLPNWWVVTFLGTIIFAFLYWVHYEIAGGPNLQQELDVALQRIERMQAHAPAQETSEEDFRQIEADAGRLQAAQGTFAAKCAVCHGQKLEGLIGPNLTDNFWIHGKGSFHDIAEIIRKGVPEKGMPPWKDLMKESEIAELAVLIHGAKGSTPPNPKAPEGAEVQ